MAKKKFVYISRFSVMLFFSIFKLFEHYIQNNFPYYKDKAFQGNNI